MGVSTEKIIHSLDEYFALTENENDIRYEYHFGEIVAMEGALLRHNHITGNTYAELKKQIKGRRCIPFNSDTRLKVDTNLWVYPDVMLSCNEEDINARLYVQHPSLIVEVLSESTRNVDYALKKHHYFKIATLKYFLLIETESIFIDMYEKQGDLWVNTTYTKEDTHISLPQLDITLAIADLYEWVKFDN